jgi:selenide,water dikinase
MLDPRIDDGRTPGYRRRMRLTRTAKRAGCAAKLPPGFLFPLLERLPPVTDPNVLVGSRTADDAAVVLLPGAPETALVLTTDFFTPIVDDPYDFGAIAAANALSDVYAMGGRPIAALAIVGFPHAALEPEVLATILRGGAEKAKEAGLDVVGGHTIQSDEPIYGLAVTGVVHPGRAWTNAGARPGDALVLTKPIGTGILTTAAKNDQDERGAIGAAVRVMATLNRAACDAGLATSGVHAVTDVTGYGLLGHLRNMTRASGCAAVVEHARVPLLDGARAYAEAGIAPGGTHANRRFLVEYVRYASEVKEVDAVLLCDAQTSGGLLLAVDPAHADALVRALEERGAPCAAIVGACEEPRGTGAPGIRVV